MLLRTFAAVLGGLLLLAISAVLAGQAMSSLPRFGRSARGEEKSTYCDSNLASKVKPFSDGMLPKTQIGGESLPGLGRLLLLDTYMKPKAVESMSTSFGIHTLGRSIEGIQFRAPEGDGLPYYQYDLKQMHESGFDASKQTIVLIPGYRTDENASWVREATNGLLTLYGDNVNVVVVSWSDSNSGVYSQAVAHTTVVARQLTIFLYYLVQLSDGSIDDQQLLDKIHLVGHSLGAHIAGFVGQDFAGRLGRITGLDPAGPSFDQFTRNQRLDRSDARLVEVLHTNKGKLRYLKSLAMVPFKALVAYWSGENSDRDAGATTSGSLVIPTASETEPWFGIDSGIGHVDYYANDGSSQPGCGNKLHICDHARAIDLYIDMLQYEITLRKAHPSKRVDGGLLAFKARDYESFETGKSFSEECGDLLCTRDHLNQCRQDQVRAKCAIPLFDFELPLNELIDKLQRKHGINFAPNLNPTTLPGFYFKTTAGSLLGGSETKFVGDHFLLRIYLTKNINTFRWVEPSAEAKNWCKLGVQMIMAGGEATFMQLTHVRPSRVETVAGNGEEQWMVSIPFVHPYGSSARIQLDELIQLDVPIDKLKSSTSSGREASAEYSSAFQHLFPRSIRLNVEEEYPNSGSSSPLPACQLEIIAAEVQPLEGHYQNIGALYGNRVALGERLPVVTSEQLARELTELLTDAHASAIRLATRGGIKSIGAGLEAILVE